MDHNRPGDCPLLFHLQIRCIANRLRQNEATHFYFFPQKRSPFFYTKVYYPFQSFFQLRTKLTLLRKAPISIPVCWQEWPVDPWAELHIAKAHSGWSSLFSPFAVSDIQAMHWRGSISQPTVM